MVGRKRHRAHTRRSRRHGKRLLCKSMAGQNVSGQEPPKHILRQSSRARSASGSPAPERTVLPRLPSSARVGWVDLSARPGIALGRGSEATIKPKVQRFRLSRATASAAAEAAAAAGKRMPAGAGRTKALAVERSAIRTFDLESLHHEPLDLLPWSAASSVRCGGAGRRRL